MRVKFGMEELTVKIACAPETVNFTKFENTNRSFRLLWPPYIVVGRPLYSATVVSSFFFPHLFSVIADKLPYFYT